MKRAAVPVMKRHRRAKATNLITQVQSVCNHITSSSDPTEMRNLIPSERRDIKKRK